jgi:predicted dehydrogenase
MKETIRWGILGAGDVCEVKSGPAFHKAANSELAAVMRRDRGKAADFARRHRVASWHDTVDGLLSDPAVDAVYIATPPRYHLEHCLAALGAGKHVYLEKPMAMNGAEGAQIVEAAKQSPGKVVVAHYRRELPAFKMIGEVIKSGAIGEVRLAEVNFYLPEQGTLNPDGIDNWRLNPEISGGGLFHDLSPHLLDLLLVYFGSPLRYEGFSTRLTPGAAVDDFVQGTIVFENQIIFRGCWCFCIAPCAASERLVITGSRGRVSVPFFGDEVHLCSDAEKTLIPFANPANIQLPMIEAATRYFLGRGECPCPPADGLQVMEMIDAFTGKSGGQT